MKKSITLIAILALLSLSACKKEPKEKNQTKNDTETVEKNAPRLNDKSSTPVKQTVTNKDGDTLHFKFDNSKDVAVVTYKGKTMELPSKKPASGIWYGNEEYDLSGKGNDLTFKKGDQTIYEYHDNIVKLQAKNDSGNTLDMTFNNSTDSVKVYFNGGKEINMASKKAASGIWYGNDAYELSGKGDSYELKKDGETIFKN